MESIPASTWCRTRSPDGLVDHAVVLDAIDCFTPVLREHDVDYLLGPRQASE